MKKALKVMGFGLSFPSSMMGVFFLLKNLIDSNVINLELALLIFIIVALVLIWGIIYYAVDRKN